MAFFSVTRLRLRSLLRLPAFFAANGPILRQLETTPGLIEARLYVERGTTLWTITAWEALEAMNAFRDSGAHQKAMPKLMELSDEAHVAHGEGAAPQTLDEAFRLIVDKGRATKLRHPSPRHTAKTFPFPKSRLPPQIIRPRAPVG